MMRNSLEVGMPCVTMVALASLALSACRSRSDTAADTAITTPSAPAPAPAPTAPTLNDAQIAHIAVTANSIDSAAGAFARTRAQNADVRQFAQTMIRDHGGVNKQAVALATRLGVTPEDNAASRQLQAGADSAHANLEEATGAAFDRAYIAREVGYHQAVLDALDQTLIPQAQNAELKSLLQQVRPNIAAHLARAQQIQSSLAQ